MIKDGSETKIWTKVIDKPGISSHQTKRKHKMNFLIFYKDKKEHFTIQKEVK